MSCHVVSRSNPVYLSRPWLIYLSIDPQGHNKCLNKPSLDIEGYLQSFFIIIQASDDDKGNTSVKYNAKTTSFLFLPSPHLRTGETRQKTRMLRECEEYDFRS